MDVEVGAPAYILHYITGYKGVPLNPKPVCVAGCQKQNGCWKSDIK